MIANNGVHIEVYARTVSSKSTDSLLSLVERKLTVVVLLSLETTAKTILKKCANKGIRQYFPNTLYITLPPDPTTVPSLTSPSTSTASPTWLARPPPTSSTP